MTGNNWAGLELSGKVPGSPTSGSVGIEATNSVDIDLTAVSHHDAIRNDGLHEWVLKVTGKNVERYLGAAWDGVGLTNLALNRGYSCRYIYTYREGYAPGLLYVSLPRCMPPLTEGRR